MGNKLRKVLALGMLAFLVTAAVAHAQEAFPYIDKTVSTPADGCPGFDIAVVDEGQQVLYCYEIQNFGDCAIYDVQAYDDNGTPGDLSDDFLVSFPGLTDEDSDGQADDLAPFGFALGEHADDLPENEGSVDSLVELTGTDACSSQPVFELDFAIVIVEAFELGPCTETPFATANAWDLFTFGDVTQQDTDNTGRGAVGGDANFLNYGVGLALPGSAGARDDLVVGNDLTYTSGTVWSGNVVYGNTGTLTSVTLPNGTDFQGSPVDFAAAELYLQDASDYWSSIPDYNGTVTIQPWGGVFLNGTGTDINVFNVPGSAVSSAVYFQINAPAGSSVLVNIDGTTNSMQNFGFSLQGGITRENVVFHFYETETLTLSGIGIQGTVFAPDADILFNNGSIDGSMIGDTLTGNGEIHRVGFNGCLPLPNGSGPE